MKKGLLVLAAVVMALAPMSASAARVRGGVVVGPGYLWRMVRRRMVRPVLGAVLGPRLCGSLLCVPELG